MPYASGAYVAPTAQTEWQLGFETQVIGIGGNYVIPTGRKVVAFQTDGGTAILELNNGSGWTICENEGGVDIDTAGLNQPLLVTAPISDGSNVRIFKGGGANDNVDIWYEEQA